MSNIETARASRDAQKVLRILAHKLRAAGFLRTKSTYFVRGSRYVLEFLHVHKFSFAPAFRIHFGVRVRTDDFVAVHLNGPISDEMADPLLPGRGRYRFEYGPDPRSRELRADAMHQCFLDEGLAWFSSLEDEAVLLSAASPLTPEARAALHREISSPSGDRASAATRAVLNAS